LTALPLGPGPLWLNAELTYRCPLHCVFCYNPTGYARHTQELGTDEWCAVLRQARELGAVQLGLSGGEPLLRDDLEQIVAESSALGYYVNLITSGVGLTEARIARLKAAGLHHIQLSFQDSTRELNDFLSSTRTFELKQRVARLVKQYDYPMVMNVVLHRINIDHVSEILRLALALGADHLELANTQYYGWAFHNREHLLPDPVQVARAERAVAEFRAQHAQMKVYFVVPDYHATRPKRCVNGWGTTFLNIAPDGVALPCHEARMLPGLEFPNVRDRELSWIWHESPAFNQYRGDAWMQEPCRSCPEKAKDLGGCRCQAYLLTGDATKADPVCSLSPDHARVTEVVERATSSQVPGKRSLPLHPLLFRSDENSRRLLASSGVSSSGVSSSGVSSSAVGAAAGDLID
jgi:pyrroloquinoline quinone biosynthesis protein E